MSQETGKIEILAVYDSKIYLRYHQAKDPEDRGRFMIYERDDGAYWLDQLNPVEGTDTPKFPPSSLLAVDEGPE